MNFIYFYIFYFQTYLDLVFHITILILILEVYKKQINLNNVRTILN